MAEGKILLVDDEPLNLLLYSEMLKIEGYDCLTARDGFHAIEKTAEERPELIIMDWNMPRLDGLGALIELKKSSETNEIPVIMITGIMTSPENLKLALESGAIDFLRKPFDKIELLARVKSVLLLSRSRKELKEKYQIIKRNHIFINALMESIPHSMVYYSLDGHIIGCNHHLESALEIAKEDLIGTVVYSHFQSMDSILHQQQDKILIYSKKEVAYESKLGKKNLDALFSKTLYFNTDGEPDGVLCIMTDITEMKRMHNELLDSKKRELTSSALRLIQISEMNNNLISQLSDIMAYTDKKGKALIRSTISQFSLNSGENVWQEFETRFENVYESFYKSLNELFPDLTPGEKKLCAFLRLNLSSKDIAALTFQNSQSVDMARYRLRKKLKLSQEENLIDFLMKI